MARNIQDIIKSSKQVMKSSQEHLNELSKNTNADKQLETIFKINYYTAAKTLLIAQKMLANDQPSINDKQESETPAPASSATTKTSQHQITREEYRHSLNNNEEAGN